MSKKVIKPIVLVIVFIVAIILFGITTNKGNKDMTTTMAAARLPVISFYSGGNLIDQAHGYVDDMDEKLMRDSIIPVAGDRKLDISIASYAMGIDDISYQIRSMDSERLVAEEELKDYNVADNHITSSITIPNVLNEDEEYLIIFKLQSGDETIKYYSRVMQCSGNNAEQSLEFALKFHDKTFADDGKTFVATYMESTTGDTNTLNYVNLNSSSKQITWGDFACEQYGDASVAFKEINDSYDVITIDYVVSHVTDSGETEYYNVEEYFRLRPTDTRMYVLNYERTMNQIFNSENSFAKDPTNIMLGIRDDSVEYKTNEAENVVAFVQQGDLFSYNQTNNELTKVFSFRSPEGIDIRENWNQHDIKIVSVDEAGSIDFIVYGYMNRGNHEGEVGTCVYHYDGLAHTIEEEAFIPSKSSYEVLKAEMGKLLYVNENGILYLMFEGNVYEIKLDSLKVEKIVKNLEAGCYATSYDNQYFSWVDVDSQYSTTELSVMNLKTKEVIKINKGDDQYLRPLGFIGNDFIYGVANAADVISDAAGNTTFPMHSIIIMDVTDQTQLKEYTPASGYVDSIAIDDYTINVNLIAASNGVYTASGSDTIMNREADKSDKVYISTAGDEQKLSVMQITFSKEIDTSKVKLLYGQDIIEDRDDTVDIEKDEAIERYYVYEKGDVTLATDNISDAIKEANDRLGVVIDSKQQYVWMRARKNAVSPFENITANVTDQGSSSLIRAISAMLGYNDVSVSVTELINSGEKGVDILRSNLADANVLDLQGVDTEEILFYVSQGNPVFAMTGNNDAVIVTGYTSDGYLYYYNPDTDKTESISFKDADAMFYSGGYHFITYLK